jgi:hypothetical protein
MQKVAYICDNTESNLTKAHMEHFTIELGDNTELEIDFEYDPGESGSYNEPPSNSMITILDCRLCQYDGETQHTIKLYGIDDTLFPVDYGMIEHMIQENIEQ